MDNSAKIMAILDSRMKEAYAQIMASPEFQRMKALHAHMLWEHGTCEICTCPEWADGSQTTR